MKGQTINVEFVLHIISILYMLHSSERPTTDVHEKGNHNKKKRHKFIFFVLQDLSSMKRPVLVLGQN